MNCHCRASSVQTFLFLRTAEAACSFLELIAVNFDHPKGAEHLCQVGSFVTAEKSHKSSSFSNALLFLCWEENDISNDSMSSPGKEDAAVHDGSANDSHGVAFVLDTILSHAGVTDGHVHALIHH